MKFFAILCFIGLAASASVNQLNWQSGQSYTFNYNGRLLTGLPELANHFSGLGLKCQVELTVGSESTPEVQEFGIKISSSQFTRVNQVLKSIGGEQSSNNWRNLPLPEFTPIPDESKRHLETPSVFKLSANGGFISIVVSQEEPEWSVNFKKALVTLFQTQFWENYSEEKVSDSINMINSTPSEENIEPITYWRTQEESLDGICDVTYQVNELPTYMIREQPQTVPFPHSCPQDTEYFELVKTRDVSSCSKRTSFTYYKPGFYQCPTGNCEGMWSRSSITRYVACRTPEGKFNIQSIVNEAELQQNLFGYNTEKFLTGNMQNLTLINQMESSSRGHLNYPTSSIELKSLYYEYMLAGSISGKSEELVDQSLLDKDTSLYRTLPRNILSTGTYAKEERQSIDPSQLISQIKTLFRQIVNEDLYNIVDIPEKQITFKGLNIARVFSLLPKSSISTLYHELKGEFNSEEKKEMFKNVFFDTLVMGGSVSNIVFVKEMILNNELTSMQIISVFTFLPHYVITPTEPLLESLYELVTSSYIRQKPFLYNHAVMSYSQLIQKACLAENRLTSYPTFVFGNFCSPDSQIVLNKWIPYLQTELYHAGTSEHRNTIIVSLGLLSHKNILPIVVPYIEKFHPRSSEYTRLTRFLAVYALGNVGRIYPEIVVPLAYSVYSNPAEETEIRIAAFNLILRLNPSMGVFHRIAASTWWEKDSEVLQVVNTALFSLSNEQEINGVNTLYTSVSRKAWLVYPLIKKTSGTFPTSGVLFTSEYLKRVGVGYNRIASWINSKESLIPTDIYGRIVYYLDKFQFTPVEYAVRFTGGWNLVEQILEIINPDLKQTSQNQGYESIKNQLHKEWSHVVKQLKLKARETGLVEGALYVNLFEDSPIFHSFQSSSSDMLKEKIMPLLQNPVKMARILGGEETRLNFQRMINLAPSEFSIPSDMGFPIVVEVNMPITLSARGKMTVNAGSTSIPSIRMDIKTLYATQMTGFVGTICPFTNEFVTTGIDEHFVLNVPAEISINMNVPEHKVNIKLHALNVNKPIDILHFHIRPYTVHQKMYDFTPMTLSNNVKFIESQEITKRKEVSFGETWGLNMKAVLTTESPFVDFRSVVQKFAMYNYNPMNLLRFGWTSNGQTEYGYPSLRKHEIQIKYNPGQSMTKEMEVQVQLGVASKEQQKPFKIHIIRPTSSQVLPYRIESRPLGEVPQQQVLQHKMKSLLESLPVSEGQAMTVRVTTVFRGTGHSTGSSSYNLNFLTGREGFQQKWNLHMENESANKKFCINGHLNVPQIPIWNIESLRSHQLEFSYVNEIGFGNSCQESKIVVHGNSKSNQEQKKFSRISPEAQLLETLKLKSVSIPKLFQIADEVRKQSSILNEVDFTVTYENVPSEYMRYVQYVREVFKSVLWPYMTGTSIGQSGSYHSSESSTYRLIFSPTTQTFDLYMTTPKETIKFLHVRIPTPLSYLFPVSVTRESMLDLSKNIVGKSIYPTCKVFGKYVQTFDNVTTSLPIDNCYHLLSGDCSAKNRFGVLIRKASIPSSHHNGPMKQIRIFTGQTSIELIPQSTYSSSSYPRVKVVVNGTQVIEVATKRGHFVPIFDENKSEVCKVMESIDGVLVFKSPLVNVLFNGWKVSVEASYRNKNQLCGLCGDLNNNQLADLRGPKQCVYTKPELLVASYRVPLPTHSCQSLPRHIEEELRVETEQCSRFQVIPTKVVESFKINTGRCSSHKHEVIVRVSDICFSKIPIMKCGVKCKSNSIVEKTIPFSCLPKGKLSELYAEKAMSGQILPELENLPNSYSTKLHLPKSCEPVNKNL